MNSVTLCEIIQEKNIQLSKEQIRKIEDFAVKAKDPKVALALCCYTLDADVSKMIDVITNSDECEYAAAFVMEYDGAITYKDFLKLEEYLDDNLEPYTHGTNEDEWVKMPSSYAFGETLKEYLDDAIEQMREKAQEFEKTENDVLAK